MKLPITVLFLVSFGSVSMTGVGDVYHCTTDQKIMMPFEKTVSVEVDKFTFKMRESHVRFAKAPSNFGGGKQDLPIIYSDDAYYRI